jgi:transposase
MRGTFVDQGGLFSYIAPEARVPMNHPLRKIRQFVRDVLGELTRSLGRLYAIEGRPSIPPAQLLSALLLQVFYGIRSERQLMEQLDYNLLYRWFVGLSPDDLHVCRHGRSPLVQHLWTEDFLLSPFTNCEQLGEMLFSIFELPFALADAVIDQTIDR